MDEYDGAWRIDGITEASAIAVFESAAAAVDALAATDADARIAVPDGSEVQRLCMSRGLTVHGATRSAAVLEALRSLLAARSAIIVTVGRRDAVLVRVAEDGTVAREEVCPAASLERALDGALQQNAGLRRAVELRLPPGKRPIDLFLSAHNKADPSNPLRPNLLLRDVGRALEEAFARLDPDGQVQVAALTDLATLPAVRRAVPSRYEVLQGDEDRADAARGFRVLAGRDQGPMPATSIPAPETPTQLPETPPPTPPVAEPGVLRKEPAPQPAKAKPAAASPKTPPPTPPVGELPERPLPDTTPPEPAPAPVARPRRQWPALAAAAAVIVLLASAAAVVLHQRAPVNPLMLRGHQGPVLSVAFAPDETVVASAGRDGAVRLWDVRTGAEKGRLWRHDDAVEAVAISPDGRTLASGSDDFKIMLWDAATGEYRQTLRAHRGQVTALAFSPDGTVLASGGRDDTVRLWEARTGTLLNTLTKHDDAVASVAFAPDGRTLASASADFKVILWDARSGEYRRTLRGHRDRVTSVAFAPDGRTLAGGGQDNTIRLWDPGSGELKQTLVDRSPVTAVCFLRDGRLVSAGQNGSIRIVDPDKGEVQGVWSQDGPVLAVACGGGGNLVASAAADGIVRVWSRTIAGAAAGVQTALDHPGLRGVAR